MLAFQLAKSSNVRKLYRIFVILVLIKLDNKTGIVKAKEKMHYCTFLYLYTD